MEIRTSEAWTILGLMSIAELERGLNEAEKLLQKQILKEFGDVREEYLEDAFHDFAWSQAVEKAPEVKKLRMLNVKRLLTGDDFMEQLDDAKLMVMGRVMGSAMDGWRF